MKRNRHIEDAAYGRPPGTPCWHARRGHKADRASVLDLGILMLTALAIGATTSCRKILGLAAN